MTAGKRTKHTWKMSSFIHSQSQNNMAVMDETVQRPTLAERVKN